jgi:dipeptidyl aminopeptidase/acylaminoacyl peptidase
MLALLMGMDVGETTALRPQAVVAYMPPVDMREHVGNVQATQSLGYSEDLAPGLSPVDFVSAENPPALFIHGATDTVVPIENSHRLNRLLSEAGVMTSVITVESGHQLFEGQAKRVADRAATDWFQEHLNR